MDSGGRQAWGGTWSGYVLPSGLGQAPFASASVSGDDVCTRSCWLRTVGTVAPRSPTPFRTDRLTPHRKDCQLLALRNRLISRNPCHPRSHPFPGQSTSKDRSVGRYRSLTPTAQLGTTLSHHSCVTLSAGLLLSLPVDSGTLVSSRPHESG